MNLTGMQRLKPDRLVLRRITIDYLDSLFAEILSDKERLYYLDLNYTADISEAKDSIESIINHNCKEDSFFWTLEEKNSHEPVGYV